MDRDGLKELLKEVRAGRVPVAAALDRMKHWPVENLPFASIDHQRGLRQGCPEVIFCQGKETGQIVAIIDRMVEAGENILATRAGDDVYRAVKERYARVKYNTAGRVMTLVQRPVKKRGGSVLVLTAGTSDIPVAEEAVETLTMLGSRVMKGYDAGVAGLHRLLQHQEKLKRAKVLIVIAGMDGALPSVVGGLTDKPLVAVPTSVGYGAGSGGIAPLLTMLNSCASGIGVVNIDNGFGAAVLAHRINQAGVSGKK